MKTRIPSPKFPGIIFCFLVVLSSCLRIDQIEQMNSQPVILINGQNSMTGDSLKLTNGSGQYPIEISIQDRDNNLKSVSYEILSGQGNIFQNGISTEEIQLDKFESLLLSYSPNRTGTHILSFNVEDSFNQSSSNNLELFVFDNFLPIARFELVKPAIQHDPLEYRIDASHSYDQDLKFGGGIILFNYTFLGKSVELTSEKIGVIFPEAGIYDIGLRVQDSDNGWSNTTIKSVQIK